MSFIIKFFIKIALFFARIRFSEIFYVSELTKKVRFSKMFDNVNGGIVAYINNAFFTFHLRPKNAEHVKGISILSLSSNELAIVLQGPLVEKDHFTLETVKIYKKIFKGAAIIVSTWSTENEEELNLIRSNGVHVIVNDEPINTGPLNINLQLKSTKAGLKYVFENEYNYSIKTRTDHRYYRHDIFSYLTSIIQTFPLSNIDGQLDRLIVSSVSTCKYRIYGLTDTFMFGRTRDVYSYWDTEYYDTGIIPYQRTNTSLNPPIINGTAIVAEIYLLVKYLEKLGITLEWTLNHWWKICRDYFCIVDAYALDFYWPKYENYIEYKFTRSYSETNPRSMEFADWLQLYNDKKIDWTGVRDQEEWDYYNGSLVKSKI